MGLQEAGLWPRINSSRTSGRWLAGVNRLLLDLKNIVASCHNELSSSISLVCFIKVSVSKGTQHIIMEYQFIYQCIINGQFSIIHILYNHIPKSIDECLRPEYTIGSCDYNISYFISLIQSIIVYISHIFCIANSMHIKHVNT